MWHEFGRTAAALRRVKFEGAPWSMQQMQIEPTTKKSKPRNGLEFSFQAPTGAAAAKPPPKPASTTSHTPWVPSYVLVLSSLYCLSYRGRICMHLVTLSTGGA